MINKTKSSLYRVNFSIPSSFLQNLSQSFDKRLVFLHFANAHPEPCVILRPADGTDDHTFAQQFLENNLPIFTCIKSDMIGFRLDEIQAHILKLCVEIDLASLVVLDGLDEKFVVIKGRHGRGLGKQGDIKGIANLVDHPQQSRITDRKSNTKT